MILIDVNVLLAAQRTDHPHHDVAQPWLADLAASRRAFGVPATVWASFCRLTTDDRVFRQPTPLVEAFAFVRAVIAQPAHSRIEPGPAHVDIFERTCLKGAVTGGQVADAHLAALAIEHGASLASFDRDFARFDDLDWIRPQAG